MTPQTTMRIATSLVIALALSACGKPSVSGKYAGVEETDRFYNFTTGGNWVDHQGNAGTYSLDGNMIMLSGSLGVTISGTVSGDTIILTYPASFFMGSGPRRRTYAKQ